MQQQNFLKYLAVFCFLGFYQFCDAQVRTKIFSSDISKEILPIAENKFKIIELTPTPEFIGLMRSSLNDVSNRFSSSLPVKINLKKDALITISKGYRVYSLRIHAKEALNISLQFDDFRISSKAVLSIYTDRELTDSITSAQNNPTNIWATRVYQGNFLNIVLKEELNEDESNISISNVGFGYKRFGAEFGNIGASSPCNVNVACPAGNNWVAERNSIALIVANLEEACTGALIMNTCNTNTPYLLTAEHCLQAGNVNNWVFQFQTWSTDCLTNVGWTEDIQYNGCQLRASNGATDFALLQLNQTPPVNSGLRYAGWSRITANTGSTTILHHPRGDLMKISVDFQQPIHTSFDGVNGWLLDLDLGATEVGSSGAPYFNQNRRIIGQHYGYTQFLATCDNPNKLGGRFDLSWTGGGTNATRLSNWLDPAGTNATTTNTTNIASLHKSIGTTLLFISGPDNFCTGTGQYTIPNIPGNASVSWQSSNSSIASINPTTGLLTMVSEGTVTITSTISQCGATNVVRTKNVTTGFPYFSNLVTGADTATPYGHYTFTQPLPWSYPTASYYWEVPSGWTLLFGQGTSSIYVQAGGMGEGGPVEVEVTACGLTRLNHKYVEIGYSNCNGCIPDFVDPGDDKKQKIRLKVMPNPAHDNVTLTLLADGKLTGKPYSIQQVTITDKMGSVKKQLRFGNGQLTQNINIAGLPPDVYVVTVYDGRTWQKAKLIVQ